MNDAFKPHPNVAPILSRINRLQEKKNVPARARKTELAKISGSSYPAVSKWYTGLAHSIDIACIVAISRHYGATLDWLVTGEGISPVRDESTPGWALRARQVMKEQKLNQGDLLDVFGVSTRGAVGHYFRGRRKATLVQIHSLASKLGLSLDYLVSGVGDVGAGSEPITLELEKILNELDSKKLSYAKAMLAALRDA